MKPGQFSPGSTTQRLCLASLPPQNISLSRSRSPCFHTADYRRPSPPPVLSETVIIRRKVPVHLVVGVRCCGVQGEMVMTIQFIEQTLRGFPVVLVAAEHYSLCCPVYVNHLILKTFIRNMRAGICTLHRADYCLHEHLGAGLLHLCRQSGITPMGESNSCLLLPLVIASTYSATA